MLMTFVLVACGSGDAPSSNEAEEVAATAEEPSEPRVFQGEGVIESIDFEQSTVTIAHEDIPGFMNAMTMAFEVLEPADLKTVEVGQQVYFVVMVKEDGSYFIERFGEIPR
jgi:Cu/Ag efflux protein CusF